MVKPVIRVSAAGLKKAFANFNAHEKRGVMDKIVRTDAKGFVRDVIAITPPGGPGAPLLSGSKGSAASRGFAAIRRDLLGGKSRAGIFAVLPDGLIARAVESNGVHPAVRLWVTKDGRVFGCERALFHPDASIEKMYDHHRRYFKNGRMSSAGSYTRDIGRWKFIDRMVVGQSAFDRYLDYVAEKIGMLAGGWGGAAKQLKVPMPKIAKRHSSGECSILIGSESFRVKMKNSVSYATQADVERRAVFVLGSRKRAKRLAIRMRVEIAAALKRQLAAAS